MLVNAGVRYGGGPMRTLGGANAYAVERARWEQQGATMNFYGGEATVIGGASIANKNAIPQGYLPPGSWQLPIKAGGMASRNRIAATGALTATLQAGRPMAAALSSTSDLEATASLIVQLIAALSASGTVTASASGAAGMAASLTGAGTLSASAAGVARIAAALAGSGSISAFLSALGSMECDIAQTAEAINPDTIAAAVWAHGTALTLVDAVTLIRRISDNRLEVDLAGQRLVLYADDGTTELREWPLSTDGGEDVATATGVQTKRGAPA